MIESHVNEPDDDVNNLYYDDENPYQSDILDRPDLFYGHPEDIVNGSLDDDYPYATWEGGMEPGYDIDYNNMDEPYERPGTAYGRPEPRLYDDNDYGNDDDYYADDVGRNSFDAMFGQRPVSRYGYGRY